MTKYEIRMANGYSYKCEKMYEDFELELLQGWIHISNLHIFLNVNQVQWWRESP